LLGQHVLGLVAMFEICPPRIGAILINNISYFCFDKEKGLIGYFN